MVSMYIFKDKFHFLILLKLKLWELNQFTSTPTEVSKVSEVQQRNMFVSSLDAEVDSEDEWVRSMLKFSWNLWNFAYKLLIIAL